MSQRCVHLIAPAGSCRIFLKTLGLGSAGELIGRVQEIVGGRYRVTGNANLIDAEEDDFRGGRTDDQLRAEDIEGALADSQVAAILALRGGAWFTRVLPRIDFSVLDCRSSGVAVFGFSELTPLINIVASYKLGLGVYYMGPAFLPYGMCRFANTKGASFRTRSGSDGPGSETLRTSPSHRVGVPKSVGEVRTRSGSDGPGGETLRTSPSLPVGVPKSVGEVRTRSGSDGPGGETLRTSPSLPVGVPMGDTEQGESDAITAQAWMEARLPGEFEAYFRGVAAMIEGRGGEPSMTARRVRGEVPDKFEAKFVGGNLTVLSTMIGSRYEKCIEPTGRWLLLEDFNDKLERFDRFFSHLTLAGFWERCEGVLLGDFHNQAADLHEAVAAMLEFHLPRHRSVPVLHTSEVGHVWPMSALPLNVSASVRDDGAGAFKVTVHRKLPV